MNTWLKRKKASLCVIMAVAALSVFFISASHSQNKGGADAFAITIRHYGVDAANMERNIAIPLEDALSVIPGVRDIQSLSEDSRARVFVRFDRKGKGRYEAIRDAAQTIYESLPPSVQRPEIQNSGNTRIPVWTAAVTGGAGFDGSIAVRLERMVKPRLESLEGAGEVEISGTGLNEIVVALKPERAASAGLTPVAVASALGSSDILLPGGKIVSENIETLIVVDGRYGAESFSAAGALEEALIPLGGGGIVRLGDVASVYEREREPETYSRLDGKRTAVIAVMGNGGESGNLSRLIHEELKNFSPDLEFTILSDRGAEEAASFRSVLEAALLGAVMVALASAFFTARAHGSRKFRRASPAIVCAFSVPLICLVSAGLLSLMGLPIDRALLAGLAAGVGAAVDTAILSSERFSRCSDLAGGARAFKSLFVPLVSGSVTTIAALVPLASMSAMADGIGSIAWAVGAVNFVSLVLALTLLPPLFLWDVGDENRAASCARGVNGISGTGPRVPRIIRTYLRRLSRIFFRLFAFNTRICMKNTQAVLVCAVLLSAGAVLSVFLAGADGGQAMSGNSIYGHIEFESGLRAEEIDTLLAEYALKLKDLDFIQTVQTSARSGSGSALISFDPAKTNADRVKEAARARNIAGAFVYFPETSAAERIWEIRISGNEGGRCRELAEEAAALCAALPIVRETVLNFKEGSGRLVFRPDRGKLAGAGIYFSEAADALRRGVHGPVAYKKIRNGVETDVRIMGALGPLSRGESGALLVMAENGALRLDTLMDIHEDRDVSSIRRDNRRRTASFSVRTKAMDPRRARSAIMEALEKIDTPPGYAVEFDRDAVAAAESLSGTVLLFIMALLFCYMVIAAANESCTLPLLIVSVVPPSMAVPALILALSRLPFGAAEACAFVTVSGMAVNAAVLVSGGLDVTGTFGLYRSLRKNLPALGATGITTVAGALPFLFLRDANSLVKAIALITAAGVGSSCIFSLSVVPAMAKRFSSFFHMNKKGSA